MIKLKLSREQLFTVCGFANPVELEAKINFCLKKNRLHELDRLFTLMQIGEMLSKKYLFTCKNSYKISLKDAEAAALLSHTCTLEPRLDPLSFECNLAQQITSDLHHQLTNYQRRFYGQTNRQHLLTGANQSAGGALTNSARYIGGGAEGDPQ